MIKNSVKVNINNNKLTTPRKRGTLHVCARCKGKGFIPTLLDGDVTCSVCKGKGKNRV